jgi:small GTP-binding protein
MPQTPQINKLSRLKSYSYTFKFIIIGESGVGKTCLLLQFTDKRYRTTHQATVGVEFGVGYVDIPVAGTCKLQCWDTAGQERFRSIARSYYRGAAGVLLVYAINDQKSFDNLTPWLEDARSYAESDLVVVLVGNKCDLAKERKVSYATGQAFADYHGLYFMETSAVTGQMVDEAFAATAKLIYHQLNDKDRPGGAGASIGNRDADSQNAYLNNGIRLGGGASQGQPFESNEPCCK